jgi:hypothetical protein
VSSAVGEERRNWIRTRSNSGVIEVLSNTSYSLALPFSLSVMPPSTAPPPIPILAPPRIPAREVEEEADEDNADEKGRLEKESEEKGAVVAEGKREEVKEGGSVTVER